MNGAAFGLRFSDPDEHGILDLAAARPRLVCEDCGSRLAYNGGALPMLHNLDAAERRDFLEMIDHGWTVYGCPGCGLVGSFSPVLHG